MIIELTSDSEVLTAIEETDESTPVLLILYANWCAPFFRIKSAIEQRAQVYEGQVDFYYVDVDKCLNVAKRFNAGRLPAFYLFWRGVLKTKWNTFSSISDLGFKRRINSVLREKLWNK